MQRILMNIVSLGARVCPSACESFCAGIRYANMWSVASFLLFSAILGHTTTCCAQTPYNNAYDAYAPAHAMTNTPDTIRLNMQRYMEDYVLDSVGKWEETYNSYAHSVDFDIFSFSHLINHDGMPGSEDVLSYWDGFTIGSSGDTENYGLAGSSNGWIERQWGCMAGGGLDSTWTLVKGAPYLVAYWGGTIADAEQQTLQMMFTDGVTHRPLGVWVCNHPWPYYGSSDSDGFAHGFASNGDYFTVIAHGLDEEGHDVGKTVTHYLAQFHGDTLDQSTDWQWMDLRSLGQVSAVYFTMESTDMSPNLGMNTAAYFCLGGAEILEHVDMYASPKNVTATAQGEHDISLSWNSVPGAAYYRIYKEGVLCDSTTETSYEASGLKAYTDYYFHVQTVSEYGEESELKYASAKTLDTTAPRVPLNLKATVHEFSVDLTWDVSTDNVSVVKYTVYQDGVRQVRVKNTSYTLTGLAPGTTYTIGVEAMDQSNNSSERATIVITTLKFTPTGTEDVTQSAPVVRGYKVLKDGVLYILYNGCLYDIMGHRVE